MEPVKITSIDFEEHTSVLRSSFNELEVVVFGEYPNEKYCKVLFQKLLEIGLSEIPQFLTYHCDRVRNPQVWLNQLEKLIKVNVDKLSGDDMRHRHMKWITQIEIKRHKLEEEYKPGPKSSTVSFVHEPHVYNLEEVKKYIATLQTFEEKVLYLNDQICNYRQNPPIYVRRKKPAFDKQCELEIERLRNSEELLEKLNQKKKFQAETFPVRLPFNGELKVLCDVFFKMMNVSLQDGRPKLPWTITQATEHICSSFSDENGRPLSPATVRTYLSPSKMESRPKKHKELGIDDILKPESKE